MNLFKYDSALSNGLARVIDLLILNILWIICSLPVITLGVATTALYYSMLKIAREKDCGITKMFFHSFFQNLKQGCGLTILFLVSGIILCSGIQTYNIIGGLFGRIAIVVLFVLLFMWGVLFSYVSLPVQSLKFLFPFPVNSETPDVIPFHASLSCFHMFSLYWHSLIIPLKIL